MRSGLRWSRLTRAMPTAATSNASRSEASLACRRWVSRALLMAISACMASISSSCRWLSSGKSWLYGMSTETMPMSSRAVE
jgi:hypothetical protein